VIGGAMLVAAPPDAGWHHNAGQAMVITGVFCTLLVFIGVWRQDRGRGSGRR